MDDLEIFVITNGRKTFEFVLKSLEDQTVKRRISVISDMKWVDALNNCVDRCKSEFFLRIDDDMALHKSAVSYFCSRIPKIRKRRYGVYACKLWEDWSNKPAGGIRMYHTKMSSKIRFRPSKLGKVDKVFRGDLERHGWKQKKDPSIVGLHMLGSREDQIKYRNLWRDSNSKLSRKEFKGTFDNIIHPEYKNLPQQYSALKKIRRLNKKFDNQKYLKFMLGERR